MIYLETTRIILSEFRDEDSSLIVDLDSDSDVMRFLTDGKSTSPEEAKEALDRILALYQKHHHRLGLWKAHAKSSGKLIGWFHLRPCKKDPENVSVLELGYRLKKEFWGQGFATEVSKSLIRKAFEELGANEVFATTMAKNIASRTVMEKCGLTFTGEYIEPLFPGEDKLAVRYSLLGMRPGN